MKNLVIDYIRNSTKLHSLIVALFLVLGANLAQAATCSLEYKLPADLPPGVIIPNHATDADFMLFSWQHFLALNAPAVDGQINASGDNMTQWSKWSSTADLYDSPHPGASGSRFYPMACRSIPNFEQYRVLQQVGKVDDSFLEAQTAGLSMDPVIDADGNFLRYEILYSPAMYKEVVDQMLNQQSKLLNLSANLNLNCGKELYFGGDPSNPEMGAMMLKVAWRDASGFSAQEMAMYHTEDLLVFTPGYRNSTGKNTCALKPMAMVGMHIAHKTTKQPNWIWATFEHTLNAPDCEEQSPAPTSPGGATTNKTCPELPVTEDFIFNSSICNDNISCADCNSAPSQNGHPGQCDNPLDGGDDSWCLDLPPNPQGGISRLCRQVPAHVCSEDVSITCSSNSDCSNGAGICMESYAAVPEQNTACWNAIDDAGNGKSVWLNYELIGSQWVAKHFDQCNNQVASVVTPPADTQTPPGPVLNSDLRELVVLDTAPSIERPLLGNTTMESYDRSNCLGCHSKSYMGSFCENDTSLQCAKEDDCSSVGGSCTLYSFNTDFVYSLKLEVGQPPGLLLPGSKLLYRDAPKGNPSSRFVHWSAKSHTVLLGLAESANDPRCNGDPADTTRAFIRFVRNDLNLTDPQIGLPCQGWRLKGDPANPISFEYQDPKGDWGACREVTIAAGKGIKAKCFGAGVPENMADSGATLNVELKTGSLRYCTQYQAFQVTGGGNAKSEGNPAPEMCSAW